MVPTTTDPAARKRLRIKRRFYKKIGGTFKCHLFDKKQYDKIVDAFTNNKEQEIATCYSKYSILEENGEIFVVEKITDDFKPKRKYVPLEYVFDILYDLHVNNFHLCLNEMLAKIKENYVMPSKFADILVKSCTSCCSRFHCLVDIVNMQSYPDGAFKYILIYEYPLYMFVLLRPLTALDPIEVSMELYKIFLNFRPPVFLKVGWRHKVLVDRAMTHLQNIFGCSVDVRDAQVVYKVHDRVQKGIIDWMQENSSNNWGIGCHLLQFKMNTTPVSRDLLNSQTPENSVPYQAVFSNALTQNPYKKCESDDELSADYINYDDNNAEEFDAEETEDPLFGNEESIDELITPDMEKGQNDEKNPINVDCLIKHEVENDDYTIEITENLIEYPETISENIISDDITKEVTDNLHECRVTMITTISDDGNITTEPTEYLIECGETASENIIQQNTDNAIIENCDTILNEDSDILLIDSPSANDNIINPKSAAEQQLCIIDEDSSNETPCQESVEELEQDIKIEPHVINKGQEGK